MGFQQAQEPEKHHDDEGNLSPGPESEDDPELDARPAFTSITVTQPATKTRLGPTGQPLVRRPVPASMARSKENVNNSWALPPERTPPPRNLEISNEDIEAAKEREDLVLSKEE